MFNKNVNWFEIEKGKTPEDVKNLLDVLERFKHDDTLITLKNNHGNTLLMIAASYGNVAIVEKLLESGANPLITNNLKETALDLANKNKIGNANVTQESNKQVIKLLDSAIEKRQEALEKTPDFIYFTKKKSD